MGTHECSGKYRNPQALQTCGPCPVLTAGMLKVPCPLQPAVLYNSLCRPGLLGPGSQLLECRALTVELGDRWQEQAGLPGAAGKRPVGSWPFWKPDRIPAEVSLLGVLELT